MITNKRFFIYEIPYIYNYVLEIKGFYCVFKENIYIMASYILPYRNLGDFLIKKR